MKGWFFLWILFVWRKRMKGFKKKNKLWNDNTKMRGIRGGGAEREEYRGNAVGLLGKGDSLFWTRERRIQRKGCQPARKGELSLLNQGEEQMQRAHKASPCGSKWLSSTTAFLHQYFTSLTEVMSPSSWSLLMLKLNLIKCLPHRRQCSFLAKPSR